MNRFVRRAAELGGLSRVELDALATIMSPPEEVPAGATIVADGAEPDSSIALLEGIAARRKRLSDSTSQLLAFLVPGDGVDLYAYPLKRLDHDIVALTSCTISRMPHRDLDRLIAAHPTVGLTLWRYTMLEAAILREHLVRLAARKGSTRIAHLFCELALRLTQVGYGRAGAFELYMTQGDLGEAVGFSTIHVNRVLKDLKHKKLATFARGKLAIIDPAGLRRFADFEAAYLDPPALSGPLLSGADARS